MEKGIIAWYAFRRERAFDRLKTQRVETFCVLYVLLLSFGEKERRSKSNYDYYTTDNANHRYCVLHSVGLSGVLTGCGRERNIGV